MGAIMAARRDRLAALTADEEGLWGEFAQRMLDPEKPESAAEVYQAAHRATRHEKMADYMTEAGFDPKGAMKLPISKWHEEAIKAGVKNLKAQDIEEVIFRMRKMKK